MITFPSTPIKLIGGDFVPESSVTFARPAITVSVSQATPQHASVTKEVVFSKNFFVPTTSVALQLPAGRVRFLTQEFVPSTTLTPIPWINKGTSGTPDVPTFTGVLGGVTEDSVGSLIGYVVNNNASLTATTEDSVGSFNGYVISNYGNLIATTEDCIGVFTGSYDINIIRGLTGSITAQSEEATPAGHASVVIVEDTQRMLSALACARADASVLSILVESNQSDSARMAKGLLSLTGNTTGILSTLLSDQDNSIRYSRSLKGFNDETDNRSVGLLATAQQAVSLFANLTGDTDDCTELRQRELIPFFQEGVEVNDYIPTSVGISLLPQVFEDDGRIPGSGASETPLVTLDYWTGLFSPVTITYWGIPVGPIRLPGSHATPVADFFGEMWINHWVIRDTRNPITQSEQSIAHQGIPLRERVVGFEEDAKRPDKGQSIIVFPPTPTPDPPPGHETVSIPTRSVYFMQHSLSVTLDDDLTPIGMKNVNLSLNADSYAWQFSGSLIDIDDLPLVTSVDPVKLIITINGAVWHVLVERIEHSRKFATHDINLTGRGLTAYLSEPYYRLYSTTYNSLLGIAQIAEMQLPPSGWTLNWQQVTWNIPAGAYSHVNQTPMEALLWIAKNTGSMLIPAKAAQSITIKPRYPYLPWQFASAEPDIVIPESAIIGVTQRPVVKSDINAVYVHGGVTSGILSWCRLNGTAGDRLAPTESNNLMTDIVATRALGERILAAHALQPAIQSLTLPFDGVDMPLIELGQLAKIMLDGSPVYGIVNAVAITASLGEVAQTIQIGEETPNAWSLFKNLLPADPLLVATLASTDGVSSVMTMLDGGVVKVRGTGDVGGKYYIRSGRIDGDAPDLALSEIVI